MFCPNCGNQVPDGYSFCSYCGAQFDNSYVNQQPQYPYPQPQYQHPQYAVQQKPPKKGVNLMGVIAGVAALLVAGGIAAGIFFFGGRNGDGNIPDKPDSGNHSQDKDENADVQEEDHFSGWVVSAKWEYDQQGEFKLGRTYEYDILGRLSKEQRYNKEKNPTQYDVYTYDFDGGYTVTTYINSDGRTYIVDQFNAGGDPILHLVYDKDGTESLRHDYTYDREGRLLRKESLERQTVYLEEYTYDDAGNNILYIRYVSGIETGRIVMNYDEAGNLIREEQIPNPETSDSSEPEIYEYTYDDRGNLLKKQFIFRGKPYNHEVYFYDDENRMVLMHHFIDHLDGWQEMSRFEAYNYNENGQLTLEGRGHSYDTAKSAPEYKSFVELVTYEYDAQGRVTVESHYGTGKISSQKHTEYREDGQISYIRHTNAEGLLTGETLYTYDGSGNLLSRHFTKENNEVGDTYPGFTLHEYTYDKHGNMTSEKYYQNREVTDYYYEYEYTFIP